jgi:hypothetical protein
MKTKKYLDVEVTRKDNSIFFNPLKLSEAYLINQILKDNEYVKIKLVECDPKEYKLIFG